MEEEQSLVTPGQVLGAVGEYKAGPGTFVKGPSIIASVVGFKRISEERTEDEVSFSKTKDLRSILVFFFCLILLRLTIEKKKELPVLLVTKEKEPAVVPQIGSVVTAKVIRVNPRFASVDILCVGSKALKETFRGIIRFSFYFFSSSLSLSLSSPTFSSAAMPSLSLFPSLSLSLSLFPSLSPSFSLSFFLSLSLSLSSLSLSPSPQCY
ncbi:Exosome complex component CSL4, variant 3 [Balamuthia mandrillaris]